MSLYQCVCNEKTPKDVYCSIHCNLCATELTKEDTNQAFPPICEKCHDKVFNE